MTFRLISAPMTNDISKNIDTIKHYIEKSKESDLLVFGESFLQGFEALCWDYKKDKNIAITLEDENIVTIGKLAKEKKISISFGFFELFEKKIYSSNLFINNDGEILNVFRRITKTWTVQNVSREYETGNNFQTFFYKGRKILVAICGDIWNVDNIAVINELNPEIILWPVYIDYSAKEWNDTAKAEYIEQVSPLKAPVFMVNSYLYDNKGAVGGAYVFYKNKIIKCLPLGEIGELSIEIDKL